jgi:hypothetical protein
MPTKILRKVDISAQRKVATALIKITAAMSAADGFSSVADCISARRPVNVRPTLSGFTGALPILGASAESQGLGVAVGE